jgi:cytochrome c peroxidase
LGHDLFYGIPSELNPEGKDAGCSFCHSDNSDIDTGEEPGQLYADDGYHNIGTPRNPEIPVTFNADGSAIDPDLGLMGLTGDPRERGFFKTPTLRNVDKRKFKRWPKAYTHNGWFKSLESIVHFYNTAWFGGTTFIPGQGVVTIPYEETTAARYGLTQCPEGVETEKAALAYNCWPAPAVSGNGPGSPAIPFLLGNLGLTPEEEAAIVAYMKTLTDEHTAKAPRPYGLNKSGNRIRSTENRIRFR